MPLNQSPTLLSFALNACNDTSPSGVTDVVTGQPIYIGDVDLGVYFDLTEDEAKSLSYTTTGTLHSGRYRRVLVDSGATAANVKTGTIGLMTTVAKGINVVTSYDKGLAAGIRPVVFLNVVTPGNYCFIQELGDANVLGATSITKGGPAAGDIINSVASGLADDPTSQTPIATTIGIALTTPVINVVFRVLLDNLPTLQG